MGLFGSDFFFCMLFPPFFLYRHYQLRKTCVTGSAVRSSKLFTTSYIVWTSKCWTMIRKATAAELLVSGYVIIFFMGLSLARCIIIIHIHCQASPSAS